jgi:indolepyruvate ferredoxin oxidoreductase beta subunit
MSTRVNEADGDPSTWCILIAALGGEGGGVLADWLVQCARNTGLPVQATSVPGVAQRTGATSYYIEMLRAPMAAAAEPPVFALSPVPGRVDVVVASELLEAARMMERGFVTPERTTLIASTHRIYTTLEKMHMADGRVDAERIRSTAQTLAAQLALIDMEAIATRTGTVVSAVMFGALAGAGVLPWSRGVCEGVISDSGRSAQASLAGFAMAHDAVQAPAAPTALPAVDAGWPAQLKTTAAHGFERCLDYQGAGYAALYRSRVAALSAVAGSAAPEALCEAARHLALWMCFEDVIRVADLKSRRDRIGRVRLEVQARPGELVRVTEYFKPGIDEIAAVLPQALGLRLLALSERRGWTRAAVGLHIRSTSLWGHLMLRTLAALRPLRPHSLRFRQEHAAIEVWLAALHQTLPAAPALALVLAGLPQVIKGYGDTQRRGRENYARLWAEHLTPALADGERLRAATTVDALQRALRDTLADPEGQLNAASRANRPSASASQPIFWAAPAPRTAQAKAPGKSAPGQAR